MNVKIHQRECVYCGNNATTFDHFIPKCIVQYVEPRLPKYTCIKNWKVPACRACNCAAGSYFFAAFTTKYSFVRAKITHEVARVIGKGGFKYKWHIDNNESWVNLCQIEASRNLLGMIYPVSEMTLCDQYVIICPRLMNDTWDTSRNVEYIIDFSRYRSNRLWNSHFSKEPSAGSVSTRTDRSLLYRRVS